MITYESLIKKIDYANYDVNVKEAVIDGKPVWEIYCFQGDIDDFVTLGYLDPKTLMLDVLDGGCIDLADGFLDQWFLDQYDWSDVYDEDHVVEYSDVPKTILSSSITEEQFFEDVISVMHMEIESTLKLIKYNMEECSLTIEQLREVIDKQPKKINI